MTTDAGVTTLVELVETATGRSVPRTAAGTTLVARETDATAPRDLLASVIADATSVVGVVPRIEPSILERLVDGDGRTGRVTFDSGEESRSFDARIVLVGEARDHVRGVTEAAIRPLIDDAPVEAFVASGDSPIGVLLVDDRAVVGRFDERGLVALLVTDDDVIREWAAATARRYLEVAERFPATDA